MDAAETLRFVRVAVWTGLMTEEDARATLERVFDDPLGDHFLTVTLSGPLARQPVEDEQP